MPDLVSQSFLPERLTAVSVLRAYRDGFFPMACGDGRLRWFSPDPRGVLPLDAFHLPRGFRRVLPRLDFDVTVNTAFDEVVAGCADRRETWIDPSIARVYSDLHAGRAAHSIEVWAGGRLCGGLYGVQIGGAFFGESMFSRISEASKVALLALVDLLRSGGFGLLDIQWVTGHLESFGAREISRAAYIKRLRDAMQWDCLFPARGPVVVPGLSRDRPRPIAGFAR
ncbi:MAG: leucyl/phenylalanyl-tRNA--protein transferase [Chthoniobacterales bacterium]|nr:leucyl/phenylalanyl-tRNA--protein transferase [Chthoniobacterales bacterium]